MKQATNAKTIIRTLESGGFYAQCPCCEEPILLRNAGLFYRDDFTPEAEALYGKRLSELKERAKTLRELRNSISAKSQIGARAVNIGFILERLAPALRSFRFERNDCRSLFDPIDYLIFEGLTKNGVVSKILFVDIKTGNARLKANQKEIKSLVEKNRVAWDTYDLEGAN